ncbi:hypothetical protein ACFL3G_03500 [Planctomycetota bacterium]
MKKKIKFGKIFIVVFLTVLIWVWADLAEDETYTISNALISVDKSTPRDLWVTFNDKSTIVADEIVVKGSGGKISELRKHLVTGQLKSQFFLYPNQDRGSVLSGKYDLSELLKENDTLKRYGVTIQSCKPSAISVNIVKLVKKTLEVKCVDENMTAVKAQTIQPAKIDMYVLGDWEGDSLIAYASLTNTETQQARIDNIEKTAYVEFAPGQRRWSPVDVKIRLPETEKGLENYKIHPCTVGFVFTQNLAGKYDVELLNKPEMATVTILATLEAKRAYEQQPYQILINILDEDEKNVDIQTKTPVYNFPEEFVRKDEILLGQLGIQAQFRLIPKPPSQ